MNKQENNQAKTHRHRRLCGGSKGKGGGREAVKDKGGQIYGNGRECDFGGEHAMQHTDDVL